MSRGALLELVRSRCRDLTPKLIAYYMWRDMSDVAIAELQAATTRVQAIRIAEETFEVYDAAQRNWDRANQRVDEAQAFYDKWLKGEGANVGKTGSG